MPRRIAIVLILVGLSGRLLLPISHVHASSSHDHISGHDAVPHIHGFHSHADHDVHSHDPTCPGHSHHGPSDRSDSTDNGDPILTTPLGGHDANAILLGGAAFSKAVVKNSVKQFKLADVGSVLFSKIALGGSGVSIPIFTTNSAAVTVGLYISLRTLRI